MIDTCCVPGCDRASETRMCNVCWADLDRELGNVKDLLDELDVTVSRQSKQSGGGVGFVTGNPETAMPLHLGASDTAGLLRDLLASWVRDLWEQHSVDRWESCSHCHARWRAGDRMHASAGCAGEWERHVEPLDITAHALPLSRWLLRHRTWVQNHAAAGELHDELMAAFRRAQRVVSGPQDRIYLGQCWSVTTVEVDPTVGGEVDELCQADLYGVPSRPTVACHECGFEWDIADRRRWLLQQMAGEELTATELSRALPVYLGRELTAAMVRGYASRGLLMPCGVRLIGHVRSSATYRVGDLIDVLGRIASTESVREAS